MLLPAAPSLMVKAEASEPDWTIVPVTLLPATLPIDKLAAAAEYKALPVSE